MVPAHSPRRHFNARVPLLRKANRQPRAMRCRVRSMLRRVLSNVVLKVDGGASLVSGTSSTMADLNVDGIEYLVVSVNTKASALESS